MLILWAGSTLELVLLKLLTLSMYGSRTNLGVIKPWVSLIISTSFLQIVLLRQER